MAQGLNRQSWTFRYAEELSTLTKLTPEQPQPYAAIELIHKQPVRWVDGQHVACDGGGGPLGHPRIFINVDKPQICWCTYCGLPYVYRPTSIVLSLLIYPRPKRHTRSILNRCNPLHIRLNRPMIQIRCRCRKHPARRARYKVTTPI